MLHRCTIGLVRRGRFTKGSKTGRIPMTARLADALSAIRAPARTAGPLPARRRTADRGPFCAAGWSARNAPPAFPVTGHIHRLRHTLCSHLAMRGAPAKTMQELARHADLSTTMRYMHLSPASLEQAIHLLEQPVSTTSSATANRRGENGERAPSSEANRKSHVYIRSVPTEIRTLDRSSISTPRRCTPNALVALG
jgi:hypothetical protein